MIDELLDRKQTAAFCKISERTLAKQDDLPRVRLTARLIFYRKKDIEAWIDRKTALPSAA